MTTNKSPERIDRIQAFCQSGENIAKLLYHLSREVECMTNLLMVWQIRMVVQDLKKSFATLNPPSTPREYQFYNKAVTSLKAMEEKEAERVEYLTEQIVSYVDATIDAVQTDT